ncbi:putative lactoylglutathione lyase protein [Calothrix brevissima NIES-22]|nr:putative lactoylglutathione lyase protein [Calothrix brevissima NIES-22]
MTFIMNISPVLLVSDFERSLVFYDATMTALGFTRCNNFETNGTKEAQYCFDEDSKVLSIIETPGYASENIQPFTSLSSFPAKNKTTVDTFFATAIANGATEIEKPGLREDNYYATSVKDPDGHHIGAFWRN